MYVSLSLFTEVELITEEIEQSWLPTSNKRSIIGIIEYITTYISITTMVKGKVAPVLI
jgi:hypothetical protein